MLILVLEGPVLVNVTGWNCWNRAEDQLERLTFRKVSLWQHAATYLLYFVMLSG